MIPLLRHPPLRLNVDQESISLVLVLWSVEWWFGLGWWPGKPKLDAYREFYDGYFYGFHFGLWHGTATQAGFSFPLEDNE